MKATITSALVVGVLTLGASAMVGGEARAQAKPEVGRGPEAAPMPRQPGHAPSPQRPDETAPSEDAPFAQQDQTPAPPGGCPNPGRKLELIV